MAATTNNQAINAALQALSDKIDAVLHALEVRLAKLEVRMDKIEEVQRTGTQWANDVHTEMMQKFTLSVHESEQRILAKLEKSATEVQQAEARLNAKMEERQKDRSSRLFTILLTLGGWLVALAQVLLPYLHPH